MTQPTAAEQARRRFVEFTAETIKNTTATDYPSVYANEDHSWSVAQFSEGLKIEFHESTPYDSSFSVIGLNAAIANAIRRILLSEIDTIAIETVFVDNNTSVIQDEVLAARLGLIPIRVSPDGFKFIKWYYADRPDSVYSDFNTLKMSLDVHCDWFPNGKELYKAGERDPTKLYDNAHIYAKQLKFDPVPGRQEDIFAGPAAPVSVHPDILIAKLRPGQVIKCNLFLHKGIGADHAKFSPVATASYRLMPDIQILRPIIGADAKKFARCFPRGVIALRPVTAAQAAAGGGYEDHEGELHATVVNAMRDTVSRECLRHDEFKDKVKLGRIQDHFIYRIESTGQYESNELFLKAIQVLKNKCVRAKKLLKDMEQS